MRSSRSSRFDPLFAAGPSCAAWLGTRDLAHRGRHGPGVAENSRAAFRAAIAAGDAIELDIQACADGTPAVFHDRDLHRMAGRDGLVRDHRPAELTRMALVGSTETIPMLDEVLALVAGATPLMIEVKSPGPDPAPLCRATAALLADYDGRAAIASFDPKVLIWFRANAPDVPRGLIVGAKPMGFPAGAPKQLWWRRLAAAPRCEADFLAIDVNLLPGALAARVRARGLPVLTWTVRSEAERARARDHADAAIFEGAPA